MKEVQIAIRDSILFLANYTHCLKISLSASGSEVSASNWMAYFNAVWQAAIADDTPNVFLFLPNVPT